MEPGTSEAVRVLSVNVEEHAPEFGNPSWTILAACSDGKARVCARYLSHTRPGIAQAQDWLERWPSLWREV